MKVLIIALLLLSISFFGMGGVPNLVGLYTYSDLSTLKSESERVTEKAEKYFHEILNEYRSKLGKSQLKWLDIHWVAAVNHNTWMAENDQLAHYQRENTPFFSGSSPSDRISFVNDENISVRYSGENCLYNWTGFFSGTEDERALKLAKMLFHQWKSSPGHYANMIRDHHQGHAIAIRIESNGKVWGTSLFGAVNDFGASNSEIRRREMVRYKAQGFEENSLIIRNDESNEFNKSVRLSSGVLRRELLNEFELESKQNAKKERKFLTKAALKHANYLATYKTTGEKQRKGRRLFYGEDLKSRLNKASFFWAALTGQSKKAKEASVTLPFITSILSVQTIKDEIEKELNRQLGDDKAYSNYGYGIKVRKRNDAYYVTVVKVIL